LALDTSVEYFVHPQFCQHFGITPLSDHDDEIDYPYPPY
jgi:hypothetical protein